MPAFFTGLVGCVVKKEGARAEDQKSQAVWQTGLASSEPE